MTYTKRMLLALVVLLGAAGFASAQSSCPECDEDGESNPDNTYHSIDVGAIENATRSAALVDTDAAHGHEVGTESGFWAWLSLCLHAFLGEIEEVLGIDTGVDGNVEVYAEDGGIDLDATLHVGNETLDFDNSEIGDLDGMTWEAMGSVNDARRELPVTAETRVPDYDSIDIDVCLYADLGVAGC